MDGARLLDGPLHVYVDAVFGVPTSWSKKKQAEALAGTVWPIGRIDLDNIIKGMDALNEIVWVDDNQVVSIRAVKRYGPEPHLLIKVRKIGEPQDEE